MASAITAIVCFLVEGRRGSVFDLAGQHSRLPSLQPKPAQCAEGEAGDDEVSVKRRKKVVTGQETPASSALFPNA